MTDKNRASTLRTAIGLNAAFGVLPRQPLERVISRDQKAIALYDKQGYFSAQISFNDAKKMLATQKVPIASDEIFAAAMKEGAGLRLKSGEVLKVHARSAKFAAE